MHIDRQRRRTYGRHTGHRFRRHYNLGGHIGNYSSSSGGFLFGKCSNERLQKPR